ncbi:Slp family lipoprotein [Nitrosococcus wardiae]|uniref:Slp family lipoprotein n=1 Tax=Nitrosococcus wardiae TaxID=1814290 RepID=UPI001F10DC68|nr:Slp family lipoprotein [Nitrosococcus wardiae]
MSQIPSLIRQPLLENPSLHAVREDIAYYRGSEVRWGGAIARIQHQKETTVIEIIAQELGAEGRPKETDLSPGRFLVRIDGFLDPTFYRAGRDITVYGTVAEGVTSRSGEPLFPLVQVKTYYLWRPRDYPPSYYPYPYWKPRGYY